MEDIRHEQLLKVNIFLIYKIMINIMFLENVFSYEMKTAKQTLYLQIIIHDKEQNDVELLTV